MTDNKLVSYLPSTTLASNVRFRIFASDGTPSSFTPTKDATDTERFTATFTGAAGTYEGMVQTRASGGDPWVSVAVFQRFEWDGTQFTEPGGVDTIALASLLAQSSLSAEQVWVYNARSLTDKSGYSLTQAFPTNFSLLSINGSGQVSSSNMRGTDGALTSFSGLPNVTVGGYATGQSPSVLVDLSLVATTAQVNSARDAVLNRGNEAWTTATGFLTTLGSTAPSNWIAESSIADNAITSNKVSTSAIEKFWNTLTSTLTTLGSVGKLIADKLGLSLATTTDTDNILTAVNSLPTPGDATAANQQTLLNRLTSSRAGYLDKLNVTGTIANTDNADTFKADTTSLSTAIALIPTNPLLANNYTAPNNDGISTLLNRVTSDRMAKLDVAGTLAHTGNAATFRADTSVLGTLSNQEAMIGYTRPMAKQLGLVAGVTATHGEDGITVSDGDGSTVITNNGDETYTVEGA